MKLSEHLQDYIEVLDRDEGKDLPTDEREEHEKNKKLVEFCVKHLIHSRETFLEKPIAGLEKIIRDDSALGKELLDDYYTRKQIDAVPRLVRRTLQLSQLETATIPSEQTSTYIREAARTYIYGLPQASIALSRAALEQGLKERLGMQGKQYYVGLNDLIKEAAKYNLLDRTMKDWAREVGKLGDDVLHEKPATDAAALKALDKVRGVLTHLYRAEGSI